MWLDFTSVAFGLFNSKVDNELLPVLTRQDSRYNGEELDIGEDLTHQKKDKHKGIGF